ncbi:MAG TPA: zinc ribbon domain-containing protein [Pyrinomonadaceae bacterium]
MYCAACGNQLAPGLSFCSRCGYSLKERAEPRTISIAAFLTAITVLGIAGLIIMLGGALTLKRDANFSQEFIGIFMLFTFLIVGMTEMLLVRQLSRLTGQSKPVMLPASQTSIQPELTTPQARALSEPLASVTENTTRTLEYARRER